MSTLKEKVRVVFYLTFNIFLLILYANLTVFESWKVMPFLTIRVGDQSISCKTGMEPQECLLEHNLALGGRCTDLDHCDITGLDFWEHIVVKMPKKRKESVEVLKRMASEVFVFTTIKENEIYELNIDMTKITDIDRLTETQRAIIRKRDRTVYPLKSLRMILELKDDGTMLIRREMKVNPATFKEIVN